MTSDLITRLEQAEAGSRELDAEICIFLGYAGPGSEGATNIRTDPDWEGDLIFEVGSADCCHPIPKLSTSLDAIVALIGEKLPGWRWGVGGNGSAAISSPANGQFFGTVAKTAPLALACVLLRAIKEGEHG